MKSFYLENTMADIILCQDGVHLCLAVRVLSSSQTAKENNSYSNSAKLLVSMRERINNHLQGNS